MWHRRVGRSEWQSERFSAYTVPNGGRAMFSWWQKQAPEPNNTDGCDESAGGKFLCLSLARSLSRTPPPHLLLSLALSASAERSARGGVERCGTAPQSQDHILVLTFKVQGKGCQLFFNCSIFTRNQGGGGYVVKEPDQPLERVHKARPRPVKHLFAFAFSTWVWVKGLGVGV